MSKKALRNSPLVHAIIHLRFSEIPSLSPISVDCLNKLHEIMINEGFQEKIKSNINAVDMKFDQATQQMTHSNSVKHRNIFRAEGENHLVEITEDSIILKVTQYVSFSEFYSRFKSVIKGCLVAIPGLENALLKSVGLRYVNVITPEPDSSLSDYISPVYLPPKLDVIPDGVHQYGVTAKILETIENQILMLRFEEIKCNDNRVSKVLPDDLVEFDQNCGLRIGGQESWIGITSETYGILDIDHTNTFVASPRFKLDQIEETVKSLYSDTSKVFWSALTDKAQENMGVHDV